MWTTANYLVEAEMKRQGKLTHTIEGHKAKAQARTKYLLSSGPEIAAILKATVNPPKGNGTMTTDVSPVTETEMRAFFDRLVTQFVSHSQQSVDLSELRAEFERLKQSVDAADQRVQGLISENENLRNQVSTLVSERDSARRESNEWANMANQYERERNQAKSKVGDLEASAFQANETINRLRNEINDVSAKHYNLFDRASTLEARANNSENGLKHWKDRAYQLEARLSKIKAAMEEQAEEMAKAAE